MLKNARFETSATNDASTALEILPSQKPGTKLMDIVFSRRRRVEAGAFLDLMKLITFTKTHHFHDPKVNFSAPAAIFPFIFSFTGPFCAYSRLVYSLSVKYLRMLPNRLNT